LRQAELPWDDSVYSFNKYLFAKSSSDDNLLNQLRTLELHMFDWLTSWALEPDSSTLQAKQHAGLILSVLVSSVK
jgi:hypothetical protein